MEITSVKCFLEYYERIRERTVKIIKSIPPDKINWSPKEGKFTFTDNIRHIATIERYMYVETVQGKPSSYTSHGKNLADGYDNVLKFLNQLHSESVIIFRNIGDSGLKRKCLTPAGTEITVWKWLRAMVEHEIHHRAHIYANLSLLDIPTPPLFGLTAEEVKAKSK